MGGRARGRRVAVDTPGVTHWEVAQGRTGEKSLPSMPGQTELGRRLLCSSMGVREGRLALWGEATWEMSEENQPSRLPAGSRRMWQSRKITEAAPIILCAVYNQFRSYHLGF